MKSTKDNYDACMAKFEEIWLKYRELSSKYDDLVKERDDLKERLDEAHQISEKLLKETAELITNLEMQHII